MQKDYHTQQNLIKSVLILPIIILNLVFIVFLITTPTIENTCSSLIKFIKTESSEEKNAILQQCQRDLNDFEKTDGLINVSNYRKCLVKLENLYQVETCNRITIN
jgi:lipopolysaccharide export LptBFGC system permease protein LptF